MDIKVAFGLALKKARKFRNLTQEDFGIVSSRTYVSTVERGLKSITLEKLDEIATVVNLHPLSLVALAYLQTNNQVTLEDLINQITSELNEIKN